jgi:hypothetical protein
VSRYAGMDVTWLETLISFVAAADREFIQGRHARQYLESKRDDFGWCKTTLQYLRCNFNYEALGTKAKSGWRYCGAWCATSSLVITSMPGVVGPGTKFGTKSKVGFKLAKGISPGRPESYNSRSISSLTTTEDMSANCAAF